MKAQLLHHLGAPCIAKVREPTGVSFAGPELYYLNPSCLIRREPGGAVVTPAHLYSAFICLDDELLSHVTRKSFLLTGLPVETAQLLIENKVVVTDELSGQRHKELVVEVPGLPTQVLLDVTSECNCQCDHCYHADDLNNFRPSLGDVFKRIQKLKSLGISIFEVTGGEPLQRPDLADILDFIAAEGLHYYVVTNGEMLEDASDLLIRTLRCGLGLAVSIDGVDQRHDQIRHRPGLYGKLMKGLDLAHANKIPIYFISTLNQSNVDQVPAMIEVATRFETTLHLRPTIMTGNALHSGIERSDLRVALHPYFGVSNIRNGLLSTKKTIPEARYYGCGLRKRISVNSQGILYPCVMDRSEILRPIESYDQQSLVNALQAEAKTYLRNSPFCSQCSLNDKYGSDIYCGGLCRFSQSYTKENTE